MPGRALALLVDFGGVLTTPTVAATREWCASAGITYRQFVGPLIADGPDGAPSLIHRLETGQLSVAEFERLLGAAITAHAQVPVDLTGFVRDVIRAAELDDAMLAVVTDVRARGVRTGMVSNSWGLGYPRELLDPYFDDVVISGEIGIRKPDPGIYELAASRLSAPTDRCVFVDDLKANVAAAEALGMTGILHVDAPTTRARLEQLLG